MTLRILVVLALLPALAWTAGAEVAQLSASYVRDGVAVLPDDASWQRIPEVRLPLLVQMLTPPVGGGSVNSVAVRTMHDGEWLAIRLEWQDATADRGVGVDTFRDAVAVGFPVSDSEVPPSPFMGDPEHPVAIWQWTADLEADSRGQGGFSDRYPHTEGVWYFPQDSAVRRQVRAWRGFDPVVEFIATGWGTLTRRTSSEVRAASVHARGRWSVVLRRRLAVGGPEHAAFKPGETTRFIAAVWNGANREVNGRKSVTLGWAPFALEATVGSVEDR